VLREIGLKVTVDLFATGTASNSRCARYCSRTHEQGAARTDAFTMLESARPVSKRLSGMPAKIQGGGLCVSSDCAGQACGEQGHARRGTNGASGATGGHSGALVEA
jgi:hypothetical protein